MPEPALQPVPVPEVLLPLEAADFLRITDDARSDDAAVQAVDRIVAAKKLHPILIGGKRRYWRGELLRFLEHETENYLPKGRNGS